MGGNVTMLIWLGKQYLDQKEQMETYSNEKITVTLPKEFGD